MERKICVLKQSKLWMFLLMIISTSYLVLHFMVSTENIPYVDYTRSIVIENYTHCMKTDDRDFVIRSFTSMMQCLSLDVILIEPSILHCFLNENRQNLLKKRGYNSTAWLGNGHVTNFALIVEDSSELERYGIVEHSEAMGFQSWIVHASVDSWVKFSSVSHYFFAQNHHLIHTVIMYKRDMYLWHSRLDNKPDMLRNYTWEILFSKFDSSFERFYPVEFSDEYGVSFFVPSNPSYFLLQLDSCRFLECNQERGHFVYEEERKRNGAYKKLKNAYISGLKELKFQLQPALINVLLIAGTLLGWYRECDIMPHTTDVDFAAFASDVEDDNFWVERFQDNPALKLNEMMGLPELAFELNLHVGDNRVDLFFLYENGTSFWVSGHSPSKGYFFSYSYPIFQLCSAALLGHKVQVPCEPEQVIIAEYGPNWMVPVKEWEYESSPKNMGPHYYWTSEERQRAYKKFS